jgi:solute carrier family 12 sodium/potassium/chloride transporter 2
MSDLNAVEMNTMERTSSANRFQVNLVNYNETANSVNGNAEGVNEDDAYPEEMVKRRTSRIQSLRTSLRDKDKPRRESQQSARFNVAEEGDSDSNDDEENLIDNDTKYGKSFR